MLANPQQAIKTMENNWATVTQITICVIYTLFITFDMIVIVLDAKNDAKTKSAFVEGSFILLEVVQGINNSVILICYVVLFVLFLILIKRDL